MDELGKKIYFSLMLAFLVVIGPLLAFFVEHNLGYVEAYQFALVPRDWSKIHGIFTMFFFHGTIVHLFFNVVPLFVLVFLMGLFYTEISIRVIIFIILGSGIGIFFVGNPSQYHIGASGLVFGLITFLIASGIIRQNKSLLTISLLVIMFYGGSLWGMLPLKPGVSWEGHLFGAISGLFIAFLWRKKGPQRDMFLFYRNLENEEDEYSIFEDK